MAQTQVAQQVFVPNQFINTAPRPTFRPKVPGTTFSQCRRPSLDFFPLQIKGLLSALASLTQQFELVIYNFFLNYP